MKIMPTVDLETQISVPTRGWTSRETGSRILSRLRRSRWTKWTLAMLAIKLCLVLLGLFTSLIFDQHFTPANLEWLAPWYRLDVKEYMDVALNGYQPGTPDAHLVVRLPMVPLLIRGMAFLGIQNLFVAAFIACTLVSLPIPVLMEKLARMDYSEVLSERATWFLLIFPMSFCLHLPLSEGIFMVLILDAFLAARRNNWMEAGFATMLAGATRVNGVLLIPALLVEIGHQYRKDGKFDRRWLWLCLAPLGTLAYLLLNHAFYGDAFAFMKFQADFYHQRLAWPWVVVSKLFHATVTQSSLDRILFSYPEWASLILLFVSAIWACLKSRSSYMVWTILNLLLFTSTVFYFSIPRFAITIFPTFLFLADVTKARLAFSAVSCLSFGLFICLATIFAAGWWAF